MARKKTSRRRRATVTEGEEPQVMENPTDEQVEQSWMDYKTAKTDREAKEEALLASREARTAAIADEQEKYAAYTAAWDVEQEKEDAHEQLSAAHEPPPKLPPVE